MNDADKDNDRSHNARAERKGRYRFSANRTAARHKVRYVESGGGEADENCKVCRPVLKPKPETKQED